MKLISKELPLNKKKTHKVLLKALRRVKPCPNLRNNNRSNKKNFLINSLKKRNKDKLKFNRTKPLKRKLLWLRRREKMKKSSQRQELRSLRSSKRKKLSKSLKLREWNKNSCPLKPSRKPRLLLPRKLLPRQTLLD